MKECVKECKAWSGTGLHADVKNGNKVSKAAINGLLPNSCAAQGDLGAGCNYGYQCKSSFCCPHTRMFEKGFRPLMEGCFFGKSAI